MALPCLSYHRSVIERFAQMPSSLKSNARWQRLGDSQIPAMLVHPDWDSDPTVPLVLWMHGRTASKELDPGRYLRWMRAGIGACAIDLPGHGERIEASLQDAESTFEIVRRMVEEIDGIISALSDLKKFDMSRVAIGGMSAGGMAALTRLCRPHSFVCVSVEATTGSWEQQKHRPAFKKSAALIDQLNPIAHLDSWREIPVQAIHAKLDEWVRIEGQAEFIEALRKRYHDPSNIEFIQYDRTGAPSEHIGFGALAADAKDRQRGFLKRWLTE